MLYIFMYHIYIKKYFLEGGPVFSFLVGKYLGVGLYGK